MLSGQMGKQNWVFERSAEEMRLMVGTKGAVVMVIYCIYVDREVVQMWKISVDIS